MKVYTDLEFYNSDYLMGRAPKIQEGEFKYWAMMASAEIRRRTFSRIDELHDIPEEVQMCCCEVAEKLYSVEAVKGDNGLVLQSYGNDGETGTYKTDDLSASAVGRSVSTIIRRWLIQTGLMYCGVV